MTYAVLSLPDSDDKDTHGYDPEHPEHMESKAETYAETFGLERGKDYDILQPMTGGKFKDAHADILRRSVLYIDAHGDPQRSSKINIPNPDSDKGDRLYVDPDRLGLRDSLIEFVVVGACFQRPELWNTAVPPGCVVIGYKKELKFELYKHLYERFIDSRQLLKDNRTPAAHEVDIWLEHIVEWFRHIPVEPKDLPKRSEWFITVGKV